MVGGGGCGGCWWWLRANIVSIPTVTHQLVGVGVVSWTWVWMGFDNSDCAERIFENVSESVKLTEENVLFCQIF